MLGHLHVQPRHVRFVTVRGEAVRCWCVAVSIVACGVGCSDAGTSSERLAAISQAYCDLLYDCRVESSEAIGRCALFRDEIASVWEDPECFSQCVQETTCEDLEGGSADAWTSCPCERAGAAMICERADACGMLDVSVTTCITDPSAALDIYEKKVPCLASCFEAYACSEIPTECNELRPGTPCYTNSDDVPEPDFMIPPCTPGETVPVQDMMGCALAGLEAVLVCQSDGKFRVTECREPADPWAMYDDAAGTGATGGGGGGSSGTGGQMTIDNGDTGPVGRGTAACQDWQDAACDFASDLCGWRPREACDVEFWSYECLSDETALACADTLRTIATCTTPSECDAPAIVDPAPARAKCEDLAKAICAVETRCDPAVSMSLCIESRRLDLQCAQALGASLTYEECLEAVTNATCDWFVASALATSVPSCAGAILWIP